MNSYLAIKGFADIPIRVKIGHSVGELLEILDVTRSDLIGSLFMIHGIGVMEIKNIDVGREIEFICDFVDTIEYWSGKQ